MPSNNVVCANVTHVMLGRRCVTNYVQQPSNAFLYQGIRIKRCKIKF